MINKIVSFFSGSKTKKSVGHIDKITSKMIYGWCFNPNTPLQAQKIEVILNGNEKFEGKTGKLRKDLIKNGYSNGKHGFEIKLGRPLTAKDTIKVFASDGSELTPSSGFVKKIKSASISSSKKSKIFGKIESIQGGIVYGWFIDPDDAKKVFSMDLRIDDKKVIPVKNNLFRQHLKSRFQKTKIGGFEVDLSDELCDAEQHMIDLLDPSGKSLDTSFFRSRLVNIECQILSTDNNTIIGWCRNKLIPENRLKIELFVNKTIRRIISASDDMSEEVSMSVPGNYGFRVDLNGFEPNSEVMLMVANEKVIYKTVLKSN